jgi:ribonuclease R
VKLDDTGADGFIPARTIGNEYFRYQEDRHAMIGDTSGETYRLGDTVTVKLIEVAPVAGALRFELLSEGRYDGRKPTGGPARKKDTKTDQKEERDRGNKRRGKNKRRR